MEGALRHPEIPTQQANCATYPAPMSGPLEPKTLRYRPLHVRRPHHQGPGQSVPAPAANPAPGLTASTTASQQPQRSRRHRTGSPSVLPRSQTRHLQDHQRRPRPVIDNGSNQHYIFGTLFRRTVRLPNLGTSDRKPRFLAREGADINAEPGRQADLRR